LWKFQRSASAFSLSTQPVSSRMLLVTVEALYHGLREWRPSLRFRYTVTASKPEHPVNSTET